MPLYKFGVALLYSVVVDGLGRTIIDQGSDQIMQQFHTTNAAAIKGGMFDQADPITDAQANALFTDEYYGL